MSKQRFLRSLGSGAMLLLVMGSGPCDRNICFENESAGVQASAETSPEVEPEPSTRKSTIRRLPLVYERNVGQFDSRAKFVARRGPLTLFLADDEVVLSVAPPRTSKKPVVPSRMARASETPETHETQEKPAVLRMRVGEARPSFVLGETELKGHSNYFIGNDPDKWQTNVKHFARATYREIKDGVDLVFHESSLGDLEYDFVVKPGAQVDDLVMELDGADDIKPTDTGDLEISVGGQMIRQVAPLVYQRAAGARRPIAAQYRLRGPRQVGFSVASYDRAMPLVIDPITYLGGSDTFGEGATRIAVDSSGYTYVAGLTSSVDFPITPGAYQTSLLTVGAASQAFVTKLDTNLSNILFSTYLGGSESNTDNQGIAIDASGFTYLTGVTDSNDFPITAGAFQTSHKGGVHGDGGYDVYVTKLGASGSGLMYSSFLGGTEDDISQEIEVDNMGHAYVAGATSSIDFPLTVGAVQTSRAGTDDAFLTKVSTNGTTLVYSTLLGGGDFDGIDACAIDNSGYAYVAGWTWSTDFPVTGGAHQTVLSGGGDTFIAKLDTNGSSIRYATLLGGSSKDDYANDIAVDASGYAYLSGWTFSSDFPVTISAYQTVHRGPSDAFVAKIETNGAALMFSTYLGGSGSDFWPSIAIDSSGYAYVAGVTSSSDFPTTFGAFSRTYSGSDDVFVAKMETNGANIVAATYLGGTDVEGDYFADIALDFSGSVFVSGTTRSGDFPVTSGAYQTSLHGTQDSFVAKFDSTTLNLASAVIDGGIGNDGGIGEDGGFDEIPDASTSDGPNLTDSGMNAQDDMPVDTCASDSGGQLGCSFGNIAGDPSHGLVPIVLVGLMVFVAICRRRFGGGVRRA